MQPIIRNWVPDARYIFLSVFLFDLTSGQNSVNPSTIIRAILILTPEKNTWKSDIVAHKSLGVVYEFTKGSRDERGVRGG